MNNNSSVEWSDIDKVAVKILKTSLNCSCCFSSIENGTNVINSSKKEANLDINNNLDEGKANNNNISIYNKIIDPMLRSQKDTLNELLNKWKTHEKYLKQLLHQYTIILKNYDNQSNEEDNIKEEDIDFKFQELKDQIYELSIDKQIEENLLNTIQKSAIISSCIFPEDQTNLKNNYNEEEGDENEKYTMLKDKLRLLITNKDRRISNLSYLLKENEILSNDLEKIIRENQKLVQSNRNMWSMIKINKEKKENDQDVEIKELTEYINHITTQIEVLKTIFKSLIIESKINWFNDDLLHNVMLELEEFSPL